MTTVVRLPEFVPPKSFTVDINSNYEDEINHQLSSPLSSYLQVPMQDTTGNNSRVQVVLRHPQYYPECLESTKNQLNGLHSEMNTLRQEFDQKCQRLEEMISDLKAECEANKKLLLDWETKSRLVQALNDLHVFKEHVIPQDLYDSLKVEGCNYLPYLLSVCAIYYKDEVTAGLNISRKEQDKYEAKAAKLIQEGLMDSVNTIWYSLPDVDRDLIIKLWLTRPNIRTLMAHPTPTVEEGMNAISDVSQLSEAERYFVNHFLPKAVDKGQEHLFTQTA